MRASRCLLLWVAACLLSSHLPAAEIPPDFPSELVPALQEAHEQFEADDFTSAERTLRKLLDYLPENVFLLSRLGSVLINEDKLEEADGVLKRALVADSNDSSSHFLLGFLSRRRGNLDGAIAEFNRALAANEESAVAHQYLAYALLNATPPDRENARQHYERAVELGIDRDPDMEEFLQDSTVAAADAVSVGATNETEPAANAADAELPNPPAPPSDEQATANLPPELLPLARKGKAQFERGDFPAAETTYRRILKKAPDNVYVLSNLGVTLFRAAKFKKAEKSFKRAIKVAPEDGFSHCTLGIVYYSEQKYDDAVNELTKALAINPENATAYNYRGITASQKGWQETAQTDLEAAVKIDPKYADAEFNLAVVLAIKFPPDKASAQEHYARAMKLGAERDTALEQIVGPPGENAVADDASAPAVGKNVAPEAASKLAPRSDLPLELLSMAREAREQFEGGHYVEAEKIYRTVLEKYPNNLDALSELGMVLVFAQKLGPAEQTFMEAIAAAPEDASSHCMLGVVYYSEGKYDEAATELTKALGIDPKSVTAHTYLDVVARQK